MSFWRRFDKVAIAAYGGRLEQALCGSRASGVAWARHTSSAQRVAPPCNVARPNLSCAGASVREYHASSSKLSAKHGGAPTIEGSAAAVNEAADIGGPATSTKDGPVPTATVEGIAAAVDDVADKGNRSSGSTNKGDTNQGGTAADSASATTEGTMDSTTASAAAEVPQPTRPLSSDERSEAVERSSESADQSEAGGAGSSAGKHSEVDTRVLLLEEALKHVAQEGWSRAAIAKAAKELQLSPAITGLCNRGGADLVEFFIQRCNDDLFKRIADEGPAFAEKSSHDRILLALRWRLEMLSPVISTWPKAMAIMAMPENIPGAIEQMRTLIDGILASCGDSPPRTSSDVAYYTQRAGLQGLYTTAELYMMTDFSPGHADTWAALEKGMEGANALEQGFKQAELSLLELANRVKMFGGRG